MEACIRLVANWRRIPMNRPCGAAVRSFCQITLTTCLKKYDVAFLPFLFLCQRCSIDLIFLQQPVVWRHVRFASLPKYSLINSGQYCT